MNPIQRQLFGPGVAVMLIMLICPPWIKITHRVVLGSAGRNPSLMQTETQEFAGYSLLWEPPQAHQSVQAPNYAVPGDYNETVRIDFRLFTSAMADGGFSLRGGVVVFQRLR